ncbi:ribosome maturation factor RimM [Fibrobacter sp. UWP2]|uniref:ribosome maturation factor RimM n=1 Tax=Fibrobacter sp. UWP2 TaxID=1896216 RepID=UPI0009201D91|nr:ribosome maturation factor RimM [Fibrobacter sp. UWP2]SHI85558.1 16S rRNA processing protein RimM [Fibrobacter sp. UWP2]
MPESEAYITVCQLMRTHGVKGYIKAMPLTHDLNRHASLKNVLLKKTNGEEVELELEDSKLANTLWLLKFKGYDTPESLVHFVNGDIMIPESERLPAPEGEYYLDDLEGFRVHTEDGRDVGKVLEVQELPTVNAFHIQFDAEFQGEFSTKSILAPWIGDCVKQIDEEGRFILCDADYLRALCPEVRE